MTIRGHVNGTIIVLDEPVDLPGNATVEVDIRPVTQPAPANSAVIAGRLAAFEEFRKRTANDPVIPVELLRREHLYD